ncbi:MAG: MoaD/ThiS family protein [Deltaproteobacteria bacterium]|nr:MoaD/ThiS family protein [Deltaproteobacteria bacterium]
MGIRINIHPDLFGATNGQEVAEVEGRTVGECLSNLAAKFPGLEKSLFDKGKGKLQSIFDIWVNGESAYPEELSKEVQDGDEIHITMVVGGG